LNNPQAVLINSPTSFELKATLIKLWLWELIVETDQNRTMVGCSGHQVHQCHFLEVATPFYVCNGSV